MIIIIYLAFIIAYLIHIIITIEYAEKFRKGIINIDTKYKPKKPIVLFILYMDVILFVVLLVSMIISLISYCYGG